MGTTLTVSRGSDQSGKGFRKVGFTLKVSDPNFDRITWVLPYSTSSDIVMVGLQ